MKELNKKIYPKSGMLSIGELAKKTQTQIVTIRYYESLKLFPDPRPKNSPRNRLYSDSYIPRLFFIKKARALNFSLNEIKEMIKWAEMKKKIPKKRLIKKVYSKMEIIDDRIGELRTLRKTLFKLIGKAKN